MVRSRLALVALAGSLFLTAGCHHLCCEDHCHHEGFLSKFRFAQRHRECDCVATGVPVVSAMPASGPVLVSPDAAMQPHYQPGMTPFAPPPRIVPVPQANPMPYTPK